MFIGFVNFLRLPPIIRGILWGVGTRILKIQLTEAEISAKQKFEGEDIFCTPFITLDKTSLGGSAKLEDTS